METKETLPAAFTKEEIEDFKNGSFNYPLMTYEGQEDNITLVTEIVSISGMADNEGIPTEITMHQHEKGKPIVRLVYKLGKTTTIKNK